MFNVPYVGSTVGAATKITSVNFVVYNNWGNRNYVLFNICAWARCNRFNTREMNMQREEIAHATGSTHRTAGVDLGR